ncbi:hypothetical protein HO173_000424 [Letharia columbiana]|uniref:Major facilitator superfamily (MFS) profile domain-containing protein n=1 Tax=Letharia columbiana TaxID=112416 RepID=A0A8H6G6V3_9LECA|nr:uncharacterized protein HO173_000424 [Letharia columbiana]KAF6241713.1 hypothetical protein HO173_000424 [Letharia columbiana]
MTIASLLRGVTSALIPISPSATLAIVFLILQSCTRVIGLRTAFVASMFPPAERTAFMGITNVARTYSQSIGTIVTGALGESRMFWVTFVLSGSMYAAYGVGTLVLFTGRKPGEGRQDEHDEEGRGEEDSEAGRQRQDRSSA